GHLVRRLYAGLGLSRRPGAPDGLQRTAFRLLVGRTAEARRLRRLRNCAQGGHAMCADKVGPYDAVIVGSGVSGALIAKALGLAKKKVLLIEAGEKLPPNINAYMDRFLMTTAKVPESPYPPELFSGNKLTDPGTINAGRPTVLSLGANGKFGDWQDPKQSYLIQKGPLPFASTYERVNGGTVRHWLGTCLRFVPRDFEMKKYVDSFPNW